jgi:hypothetical protein
VTQPGAPSPAAGALAGKRLMVATPMYEGMCHALYTRGLVELALKCREAGVALSLNLITNQASIAHARAYFAGAFLQSDCDHLMMIDADMGFAATDVMTLLSLQAVSGHHVIGAAGSHKRIDWERVGIAARADAALPLARVASPVAVNLAPGEGELRLDEPQAVDDLGSAFMMVSRAALEQLGAAHPELAFTPTPDARRAFGLGEKVVALFDTLIDETGAYLSEDYAFCRRVRAAGMEVWLVPWIELAHVGNMAFTGSIPEIARFAACLSNAEN